MGNGNFYEIFAKISLQNVFPDEFSNLTLSDRPDLIDDTRKLGVEVTYATNEKDEKLNETIEKIDLENICDKILNDYEAVISKESN